MLASRAASLLRNSAAVSYRRHLAIMPTVKTATDTSSMEFPAPSHVSITSEAADIARQITEFYSNPESVVSLSPEVQAAVQAEIEKRVGTIPEIDLPKSWVSSNLRVPSDVRLGDNPLFIKK